MSEKHSPLPWKVRGRCIYDAQEFVLTDQATSDDSKFIVRACNAHEELLAALKAYHSANRCKHDGDWALYDIGQAAIAKAEGQ